MSISEIAHSEPVLTLLGTVLGGLWAFFKTSDWFGRLRRRRYYRAIDALEAGVEAAYREYVRAIKEGRADGKLTEDEKRRARRIALDKAIGIARRDGIDLIRTLGEEYLDLWLDRLVTRRKK